MKTNFTPFRYFVLVIALQFLTSDIKADNLYNFNFNSTPVLVSGTNLAVGAKYQFLNVATGTQAIVTIMSATGGATVIMIDDNSLTMPEAFSPQVRIPANSTGMVEFKIEFFTGSGNSNNPRIIDTLRATAMDIDGNNNLHEMDALNMGGGVVSYLSNTLEINVAQASTEFLATNIAGNEYGGVDTSAKEVMFTVTNTAISSFTYKAGGNNQASSAVTRQKGIYFKGFNYLIMPVKYLSFDAVVNGESVLLKWITAQELNHSHFEVERSFDMNSYNTAGLVLDGFTTNGSGKSYQFKDNSAQLKGRSMVYYRLKQVDIDGKVTYSKVLAVRLQAKSDVTMQVSPNPFVEDITIRFASTENATAQIRITNLAGQTMLSKQSTITKGYNNIKIESLSGLAAGMYMVQLTMNGTVINNQKLIKN